MFSSLVRFPNVWNDLGGPRGRFVAKTDRSLVLDARVIGTRRAEEISIEY
jgi:hypothetical protein